MFDRGVGEGRRELSEVAPTAFQEGYIAGYEQGWEDGRRSDV
jgi:hypothetical protein